MVEWVQQVLAGLYGLDPWLLYGIAGLFLVLETTALVGLVVPGDSVVLLAGSTAVDAGRVALLITTTTAGTLIGESLGWLIGHRFGDGFRHGRVGRRLGEQRWAHAEEVFRHNAVRAVLGARFVAAVHALVPIMAGTLGMPYRRFIALCLPAALAWSALCTGVGAAAGASFRTWGDRIGLVGWVLLGLLGLALLLGRTRRRRRGLRSDRPSRPATDAPGGTRPPAGSADAPRPAVPRGPASTAAGKHPRPPGASRP
jgi:membrane-associated protein